METKQMAIADLNVVFGKKEESLISRLNDIVMPALQSGIKREGSNKTEFIFENVKLEKNLENELTINGLIIKKAVVEIKTEYTEELGLKKTNKHYDTAPYSAFVIYLKNHRMVLVKNESESPDIRSFAVTFREILHSYVKQYNKSVEDKSKKLPSPRVNVAGLKTAQSVKETLADVEKIEQLVFKFYPLNAEWDYNSVFGDIDKKIRKVIRSNKGRMIFPSPNSLDGVAEIIEATDGLVKTEMKVQYKSDLSCFETKKRGVIKDSQISENVNIDINNELDIAFDEINSYKKDIKGLNVYTDNQIREYETFMKQHSNE